MSLQNVNCIDKTDVLMIDEEDNLFGDEYEKYKNIVETFKFEQFSGVKSITDCVDCQEIEKIENPNNDIPVSEVIKLKEIKKQHPLNIEVMVQSARNLDIAGVVDEHSYVNVENVEAIVNECKRLNVEKANANNPKYKKEEKNLRFEDKNTTSIFESLIREGYIVVIDTCSLMHDDMQEIMNDSIIPILEKYKRFVYITVPIYREIEKKLRSKDMYTYYKAESARSILALLGEKGLYRMIRNDCGDEDFADAHLITLFTGKRRKCKMCLITNDNKHSNKGGLAGSISRLSDDPCINDIIPIKVLSIHSYEEEAKLIEFSLNKDSNFSLHEHAPIIVKL